MQKQHFFNVSKEGVKLDNFISAHEILTGDGLGHEANPGGGLGHEANPGGGLGHEVGHVYSNFSKQNNVLVEIADSSELSLSDLMLLKKSS